MVQRFTIVPERSAVVIQARTSVGPVTWEASHPNGEFAATFNTDGTVDFAGAPTGWIEVEVERLTSGNRVYDGELMRRVSARRFPTASVRLVQSEPLANHAYRATAVVTFHGNDCTVAGTLAVTLQDDGSVRITGEQDIDIRDFDIPAPTMLLLKIYPDVRVRVELEGRPAA